MVLPLLERMMPGRWLAVLLLLTTSACANHPSAPPEALQLKSLNVADMTRSYYLHLPSLSTHKPNPTNPTPRPILLILHGGGKADGDDVAARTGYNHIADREGFIAVYPNGIDAQWNDGRGKSFRRNQGNQDIDDVAFLSQLINHIITAHNGDPSRVYVTGLSNGGMMTLRLGCEISHQLAAIAPIIANFPKTLLPQCQPSHPLPVLIMNGTDDPLIPWQGGSVGFLKRKMGHVASTEATLEFWRQHNQCPPTPTITQLPDNNSKDASTVSKIHYHQPGSQCDVVLYKIKGGGHNFPGSPTRDRPLLLGHKNNDINGPEVVWDFLKQHRRYPNSP